MKDDPYERQARKSVGACTPIVEGMAIVLVATLDYRQLEREYTYTRRLCIDRLNTEGGVDSALWLLRGDSHELFLKVTQVKSMHDKPAYVQILPTVSQSSCLGWTTVSIAWYHPLTSYFFAINMAVPSCRQQNNKHYLATRHSLCAVP